MILLVFLAIFESKPNIMSYLQVFEACLLLITMV